MRGRGELAFFPHGEGPHCLTLSKYGQGPLREGERWVLIEPVGDVSCLMMGSPRGSGAEVRTVRAPRGVAHGGVAQRGSARAVLEGYQLLSSETCAMVS